jgi:hypothetical protein
VGGAVVLTTVVLVVVGSVEVAAGTVVEAPDSPGPVAKAVRLAGVSEWVAAAAMPPANTATTATPSGTKGERLIGEVSAG